MICRIYKLLIARSQLAPTARLPGVKRYRYVIVNDNDNDNDNTLIEVQNITWVKIIISFAMQVQS